MNNLTKEIAIDHFNRISKGDIAGAAALMAEDCVDHGALPQAQGRAGFAAIMSKVLKAFPDMRQTLDDLLVDGDKAVLRVTCTGTQTGPVEFVHMPMKPTGKAVKFEQIHIVRVANGQIVEHWLGQDSLALFRQLGVQLNPPS